MLTQPKEEKQKKYRQSDGFIVPMNAGNAAGWHYVPVPGKKV